jgi:hypothetical protein
MRATASATKQIVGLNLLKSIEPNWFAIKNLLCQEWFSRLWVLQEVGLATSATLYFGQHSIDWKLFNSAIEWLWKHLTELNHAIPSLEIADFADSTILAFIKCSSEAILSTGS